MIEKWKPVVGFESLYEVSDQGRVKSLDRIVPGKYGLTIRKGKLLKLSTKPDNNKQVSLSFEGIVKKKLVHRLVLESFVGPMPKGYETCHKDDCPDNNKLRNLRWDTRKSNIKDRIRNGKTKQISVIRDDGKKFDRIIEAANGNIILAGNITAVCRGRRSKASGYSWSYCKKGNL